MVSSTHCWNDPFDPPNPSEHALQRLDRSDRIADPTTGVKSKPKHQHALDILEQTFEPISSCAVDPAFPHNSAKERAIDRPPHAVTLHCTINRLIEVQSHRKVNEE